MKKREPADLLDFVADREQKKSLIFAEVKNEWNKKSMSKEKRASKADLLR